jgi:hypothetical protein
MAQPLSGLQVRFSTKGYELDYSSEGEFQSLTGRIREVTNYEYESKLNDEKRQILVLKPEYLGAFVDDVKNMMNYNKSSQFVDKKTKRAYNSRLQ